MLTSFFLFCVLLFVVAMLYSSVGHGGASGYLALMALYGMAPEVMKPTAQLLNIFVSLIAFIQFYRAGYFKGKLFIQLAVVSVPAAFIGGLISVDAVLYRKILGCLLLLPVIRFFFFTRNDVEQIKSSSPALSLLIGSSIGFVSGLIGIGGGILLSPVLLLLKWANQKQAAALSAAFIFVNSLSGLSAQISKGNYFSNEMIRYILIAFTGGIIGSYFGAKKFNHLIIKNMLAVVLMIAALKLIFI